MENNYIVVQSSIKPEVKEKIEEQGFGVSAMIRKILTDWYEYKNIQSKPFKIVDDE